MRIMVVDDEILATNNLMRLIQTVEPEAEVFGFSQPAEAFAALAQQNVDIAFLDIDLGERNGIELAKACKECYPNINIIFVTGHSQYMMEAFQLHASGYLMKPVRVSDLQEELQNLRHPVLAVNKHRIRVQTFGHFEIFVDQNVLKFTRTKSKECLAYLIDRKGARVTYPQLSAILWEDRPYNRTVQNNTQKVISDLMKTLKSVGAQQLVIKSRQDIAIDPAIIDCDYYAALSGDMARMNAFYGKYMSNYSWAESTSGD